MSHAALFEPGEGARRLLGDWPRIFFAQEIKDGRRTVEAAFLSVYGHELGPRPTAKEIRNHVTRELESGEPAVFDMILARFVVAHFGAIDGRALSAGVYLAAGANRARVRS